MWKKVEKMFHVLHKVEMGVCYAKQKINLAYPYGSGLIKDTTVEKFYILLDESKSRHKNIEEQTEMLR